MTTPPGTPEPAHAPDGQVADAVRGNWVDRLAPSPVRPYLRLSRADRPIGTWLLYIPCLWGLALAAAAGGGFRPWDLWIAAGCGLGAFLMRGAGCTWNDITDRHFDAQVARTRSRPLPSGQVTVRQALAWMGGQALLAAPNGVADVLEAFGKRAAGAAGQAVLAADNLKVRDEVRAGVKGWLAALDAHKPAVKRAAASPANLLTGPKGLWAGADAIWAALGDKSTDYNWYTKRGILSGVIGSTLACWAGTDDQAAIDAFLDRRIENVMEFEKTKKKVQDAVKSWPDPLDFILGKKQGGAG